MQEKRKHEAVFNEFASNKRPSTSSKLAEGYWCKASAVIIMTVCDNTYVTQIAASRLTHRNWLWNQVMQRIFNTNWQHCSTSL